MYFAHAGFPEAYNILGGQFAVILRFESQGFAQNFHLTLTIGESLSLLNRKFRIAYLSFYIFANRQFHRVDYAAKMPLGKG